MKNADQHTMTANDLTRVDDTHMAEQNRAVEALTTALKTEEVDEFSRLLDAYLRRAVSHRTK